LKPAQANSSQNPLKKPTTKQTKSGGVQDEGPEFKPHNKATKRVVKYCVLMYENGKIRPVETIPEMGGG
jgi:hypothetical protein